MLCVVVPIRTTNGLNDREHWRTKSRRVRKEREAVAWVLSPIKPPAVPVVVTLVRVGPSNGMDDDNLAGACKAVRDEVARWLKVDDRDPRVTWRYEQARTKEWAVEVRIA